MCGRRASNCHHVARRSWGKTFRLVTLNGVWELRSPLFALCGPAARAAAAIMANAVASFNEALVPVLRGVRREARALCKRLDPKWRRAWIRALKRSRRNVETLKREGRCR